jgi:DNA polymerase III delta subunit
MMVPRRVIVVLEAEKLLVPKRESKATEEDQERLTEFIKAPAPASTVVFVCSGLDKRRTLVKLLLKQAQVVDCGTIESAEDAERWLKNRAARERVTFEPAAARALVERAGQGRRPPPSGVRFGWSSMRLARRRSRWTTCGSRCPRSRSRRSISG